MKVFRNWKEIATISCLHTRFALANCADEAALCRLTAAFPECFRESADNEADRFSWSGILRIAEDLASQEWESRPPYKFLPYAWLQCRRGVEELECIPVFAQFFDNANIAAGKGAGAAYYPKVPEDIVRQLHAMRGRILKGPMFLDYRGVRCVVGWIWFEGAGPSIPREGEVFDLDDANIDGIQDLILVRADVIAFDC